MQYYFRDPAQNTGATSMPGQYNPMMNMTQPQLESMYPNTYNIVQPAVENACNNMLANKGPMYAPNKEDINNMVNEVYSKVENEVETMIKKNTSERERQFFGGSRFLLRDLVGILLINNLVRRRRPFFGYPGFYGGYWPYGGFMY